MSESRKSPWAVHIEDADDLVVLEFVEELDARATFLVMSDAICLACNTDEDGLKVSLVEPIDERMFGDVEGTV